MQGPQQWCIEASVEQLALVRADIDEVAEWVQVDFAQALLTLLKFAPEQVHRSSCISAHIMMLAQAAFNVQV